MFTLMSDIAPLEAILRMQHKIEMTKLYMISYSCRSMLQPSRESLAMGLTYSRLFVSYTPTPKISPSL